jgi:hypothetical protein
MCRVRPYDEGVAIVKACESVWTQFQCLMPLIEGLFCCKERGPSTQWSKTDETSVAEIKLPKIKLSDFVNPPSKN